MDKVGELIELDTRDPVLGLAMLRHQRDILTVLHRILYELEQINSKMKPDLSVGPTYHP